MIKLIASDLDGSLLDEHKNFPPGFFDLLGRLKQKGVTFVAASGRSYVTLAKNFSQAGDDIDFICDNGACVVEHGAMTYKNMIGSDKLKEIIRACEPIPNIKLVLCGVHGTYHLPYNETFDFEISSYYINHVLMDDLMDVEDDIFKVAICDLSNPVNNAYPVLNERFGEELAVIVSGPVWMDLMSQGVNKGVALAKIQEHLGVTPEETMAFGDFYNDIELLSRAKYSFVMENANADMKQYGNYIAKSNREYGVMKAIEEYVFGNEA